MSYYDKTEVHARPRVLGLTASILTGQCTTPKALEQSLYNLERVLDSQAETATDMVVADLNGAKPREILVECDEYVDTTGLVEQLGEILESAVIFLQVCNYCDNTLSTTRVAKRSQFSVYIEIVEVSGKKCLKFSYLFVYFTIIP